jgi:hypothetical protein
MEGLVFYVLEEAIHQTQFSGQQAVLVLIATIAAMLYYVHCAR